MLFQGNGVDPQAGGVNGAEFRSSFASSEHGTLGAAMFVLAAALLLVAGSAAPSTKKRPDILFLARCDQPSSAARRQDAGFS